MNSSSKKNWAIITVVGVPIIALTGYCGYQIFSDKEPVYTQDSFKVSAERPLSESDRVWGAAPNSACGALSNANIIRLLMPSIEMLILLKKLYNSLNIKRNQVK